ncbi:MAG: FAD-dependent oxidoreductase, partial [Actinomycetota bacterium]
MHRRHGVDVRCGVRVVGFEGTSRVSGVRLDSDLDSDEVIPADVVVVGIGVAPATQWLETSGLT